MKRHFLGWTALLAGCSVSVAAQSSTDVAATHDGLMGSLYGTLVPGDIQNGPAVLIIPGSGPTDRDGNNPLGVRAASYRLLAERLAERGITTLRIDKRGMFASAGATENANDVTIETYVADTHAWSAVLRSETGNDCVWLLGHSEGALIALASVADRSDGICGVILAASPGRPLGAILREQFKANPANASILDDAEKAISQLEAGEDIAANELPPVLLPIFGPQIQRFMKSMLAQDPAAMIADYTGPVLILHPQEDIQVALSDAQALQSAQVDAELVILEQVNHVLKQVPPGDRAVNLRSYSDASLPIAPAVTEAITEFVTRAR
ncbi:alpha/beta fold hydrolase [Erythrobacter insulae]|uniref:Alpha/beta fold hydrolase n=1 Tax=Erythrobacter insulae TaxID=2584124 RepID=A0A547PDF5_9SPHN|nr:alpha/beta fold hydrolase [Erythrobacter insulae]TRD12168.1 alpha/beta fold hydrolase [Erythrobacter insulae]